MGRYYYGDIEGKFAFGIQSSYDPEEFGTKALELHRWTCGCDSELGVKPEDCKCITNEENVQSDDCKILKFNFDSSMIDYISEKLRDIYDNSYDPEIKSKFLDYMSEEFSGERKPETYEDLAEELNTTVENLKVQYKLFYRNELGLEICEYIEDHGTCTFYGEL